MRELSNHSHLRGLCAVELPAIFSGSFLLRGSINSKSAAVHILLEEASLRLPAGVSKALETMSDESA